MEEQGLKVSLTEQAKAYVAENGFDQSFGARPLKRYIQQYIETLIAREIIANKIPPESLITVDVVADKLSLKITPKTAR